MPAIRPSLLLPIFFAILSYYTISHISTHTATSQLRNRNIALLIAHPDDEAMFFAPTIQSITSPSLNNTLRIICFSTGDADGLGSTRKHELLRSASLLGVPSVNSTVLVHDHPDLQDGMYHSWSKDLVASLLSYSLHQFENGRNDENEDANPQDEVEGDGIPVDTIITFDSYGVSGHRNHISLRTAAQWYIKVYPNKPSISLYTLTSVPLYRKYLGVIDAFISAVIADKATLYAGLDGPVVQEVKYDSGKAPESLMYLSGWEGYRLAQKAMTEGHKSQMIWFRWGWIALSRYMVFNDLKLDTIGYQEY
ncbi:N-acetylglucosaminyl-phosphatidylinositol de-N-acetylase [Orbilia ellipsospora]|uniref:N-acetylglucosaminylphosphatidylinositol deacetylase n=1 Tax=Orbilia ellipsospora TaxID=2528407 RepID=A0AAV9X330_9PEZI